MKSILTETKIKDVWGKIIRKRFETDTHISFSDTKTIHLTYTKTKVNELIIQICSEIALSSDERERMFVIIT